MVQVFADVLSYLRLYALGLAGSIMASTFNDIGQDVGLLIGWIVILFGHSVNILLGHHGRGDTWASSKFHRVVSLLLRRRRTAIQPPHETKT